MGNPGYQGRSGTGRQAADGTQSFGSESGQQEHGHTSWLTGFRPSWAQRRRMLRIEAWVVVVAAYVLLGVGYLWPQDFRNDSRAFVAGAWFVLLVRTFTFHGGLLLLCVAAVAAWRRSWRLVIAAAPVVMFTLSPVLWNYRPKQPAVRGQPITVMTVNLLMVNEQTGPIVEEIHGADPDVLLLQEYTNHWHRALQDTFGGDYPYAAWVCRDDSFGSAIYSKRPFAKKVQKYLPLESGGEPQMRAVITVDGRDVAFYNIHLLPPSSMDYMLGNREQFADLLELLRNELLPIVMAGDFNFTERSTYAAALRDIGLRDAQDVGGWGRGTTWPVLSFFRWVPGIRLDHVYVSDSLTCTSAQTGIGLGSDHRPVVTRIGWRPVDACDAE